MGEAGDPGLPAADGDQEDRPKVSEPLLGCSPNAGTRDNEEDLEDDFASIPVTDETACGFGPLRGPFLQSMANKKSLGIVFGLLGLATFANGSYFNGTITTLEKRFKFPSQTIGMLTIVPDIAGLILAPIITYYGSHSHRPRWIGFGSYLCVIAAVMIAMTHIIYGPGEDALRLTKEYGGNNFTSTTVDSLVCQTQAATDSTEDNDCRPRDDRETLAQTILITFAQLIGGCGGILYFTMGLAYIDDNVEKSSAPALLSFTFFIRMIGPSVGLGLASVVLKIYISPQLTPVINDKDPRWLGAWWLGWIIIAIIYFIVATMFAMFPKTMPEIAARRALAEERRRAGIVNKDDDIELMPHPAQLPKSLKDMSKTFCRLATNVTFMCNSCATVSFFAGYMAYWIYMPKYIELQFHQSPSMSSLATGSVGLVFFSFGLLVAGSVISRFKPEARTMATWNIFAGLLTCTGMITYSLLGCPVQGEMSLNSDGTLNTLFPCNRDCYCDYVIYSPVCAETGVTYVSPCHAGCRAAELLNGTKVYTDCRCIRPNSYLEFKSLLPSDYHSNINHEHLPLGTATPGPCPLDCQHQFYLFLAVASFLKFVSATARASNFLVSVRCIEERDKTVAMGLGASMLSLFAFMPSPIFFGYVIDQACIVWGKSREGKGNCWQYDTETLRYTFNLAAAGMILIGTLFDVGVWYFVKNVKIFDKEEEELHAELKKAKTANK